MRQVYIRQGLGVGQLRMKYGGRNKRRGVAPEPVSYTPLTLPTNREV